MNQEPNPNPPLPEAQNEPAPPIVEPETSAPEITAPESPVPETSAPETPDFAVEPLDIATSPGEPSPLAPETSFSVVSPAGETKPPLDTDAIFDAPPPDTIGTAPPESDVAPDTIEPPHEVRDRDVWAAPPPPDFSAVPTAVYVPPAEPPKPKSNLFLRIVTALIGIPIALWLVWHAGPNTFNFAVGLLALLSLRELGRAMRAGGFTLVRIFAYPALMVLLLAQPLMTSGSRWGALLVWTMPFMLVVALLCGAVLRYPQKERLTLPSIALSLFATLYVGLFVFFILLRALQWPDAQPDFFERLPPFGELPNFVPRIDRPRLGPSLLWLTLLAVWAGDTVAYFAGRKMGKEKLTPLSPGKTWEGAVAGLTATIGVSVPVAQLLGIEIGHGLALGVLIALAAPLGDLAESFWKRELGVKDVGGCLPGHGGILDRFDSLLFAVFAVYLYAQIVLLG